MVIHWGKMGLTADDETGLLTLTLKVICLPSKTDFFDQVTLTYKISNISKHDYASFSI